MFGVNNLLRTFVFKPPTYNLLLEYYFVQKYKYVFLISMQVECSRAIFYCLFEYLEMVLRVNSQGSYYKLSMRHAGLSLFKVKRRETFGL